jgi:hypothetical protein
MIRTYMRVKLPAKIPEESSVSTTGLETFLYWADIESSLMYQREVSTAFADGDKSSLSTGTPGERTHIYTVYRSVV